MIVIKWWKYFEYVCISFNTRENERGGLIIDGLFFSGKWRRKKQRSENNNDHELKIIVCCNCNV